MERLHVYWMRFKQRFDSGYGVINFWQVYVDQSSMFISCQRCMVNVWQSKVNVWLVNIISRLHLEILTVPSRWMYNSTILILQSKQTVWRRFSRAWGKHKFVIFVLFYRNVDIKKTKFHFWFIFGLLSLNQTGQHHLSSLG